MNRIFFSLCLLFPFVLNAMEETRPNNQLASVLASLMQTPESNEPSHSLYVKLTLKKHNSDMYSQPYYSDRYILTQEKTLKKIRKSNLAEMGLSNIQIKNVMLLDTSDDANIKLLIDYKTEINGDPVEKTTTAGLNTKFVEHVTENASVEIVTSVENHQ